MASSVNKEVVAEEDLSFENFKMWSTNALKSYLHVRGKNIEGSFEDLAAEVIFFPRIFC